MRGLNGKRVLITGAASGIGSACARRFHEEGALLCLVDLNQNQELVSRFGEGAVFLQADVSTEEGLAAIAGHIDTQGIDVLINNAGITRDASLAKMAMDDWDQVLLVNLTAVFRLCQLAAAAMKAQGSGVILNAASVVAHFGNFGQSNYVAAKAGVIGLTRTLSKELGKYGIRVNAVAPGFIETPMVARIPEKVLADIREKPQLRRLGRPEEAAAAYAFLASDEASYITGTVLNVDGGLIMG